MAKSVNEVKFACMYRMRARKPTVALQPYVIIPQWYTYVAHYHRRIPCAFTCSGSSPTDKCFFPHLAADHGYRLRVQHPNTGKDHVAVILSTAHAARSTHMLLSVTQSIQRPVRFCEYLRSFWDEKHDDPLLNQQTSRVPKGPFQDRPKPGFVQLLLVDHEILWSAAQHAKLCRKFTHSLCRFSAQPAHDRQFCIVKVNTLQERQIACMISSVSVRCLIR